MLRFKVANSNFIAVPSKWGSYGWPNASPFLGHRNGSTFLGVTFQALWVRKAVVHRPPHFKYVVASPPDVLFASRLFHGADTVATDVLAVLLPRTPTPIRLFS